jgi:hypothetical protein
MKRKYETCHDAILGQARDFLLVTETGIGGDGSIEVTGWGVDEGEFPPAGEAGENLLDNLLIRSAIITDDERS